MQRNENFEKKSFFENPDNKLKYDERTKRLVKNIIFGQQKRKILKNYDISEKSWKKNENSEKKNFVENVE